MARRVSVVTLDFDANSGKSFQKSGAILCSKKYIRRKPFIPVIPEHAQCFPRRTDREITYKNKCYEHATKQQMTTDKKGGPERQMDILSDCVCEGVGMRKKMSNVWKPKDSQFVPVGKPLVQTGSLSSELKLEKNLEITRHIEKGNSYNENTNCLKSLPVETFQWVIKANDKENVNSSHNGEINTFSPVKQSKEAFQQDSKQMNQLPNIFVGCKADKIRRSSAHENILVSTDNHMSQMCAFTSLTQRHVTQTGIRKVHVRAHSLDYTNSTNMNGLKSFQGMASMSVSGFPPVKNNSDEKKKTSGSYDVRYQYAINIEKNWYKNFQQEMMLKAGHNSKQGDVDTFGYCNEEIHKNSLFNHLRGEYEDSLSSRNDKQRETICGLPDQQEIKVHGPSLECGSTDVLTDGFNKLERTTPENKQYKHNIQTPYHEQKPNNETKSDNTAVPIPRLTITEIRALRLKLKKYNQTPKTLNTLKGIRRFRQIVFVVMVTLHFRKVLLKVKKCRRKKRAKTIKQQNLAKKNKIYTPFERNRSSTRKIICSKAIENNREKSVCRYEIELNRIMNDYDQFASLTKSVSPSHSRYRCLSAPGPSRPNEFCVILSTPSKRHTNRRKRNCKSASQKRDVEQGRFEERMAQRKIKNTRFKTARARVTDTGLVAEIKQQLNMKKITKTNDAKMKTQEIIVKKDLSKRRTLDDIDLSNQPAIDLRSLLKDVDIPAKEIKIQIAERKMKRKHSKYLLSLADENETAEKLKITHEKVRKEIPTRRKWAYILRRDVMSGVRWKVNQESAKATEKVECDEDIANMSSLVLQMRSCRYIRWTKRYQNILNRLDELDCSVI